MHEHRYLLGAMGFAAILAFANQSVNNPATAQAVSAEAFENLRFRTHIAQVDYTADRAFGNLTVRTAEGRCLAHHYRNPLKGADRANQFRDAKEQNLAVVLIADREWSARQEYVEAGCLYLSGFEIVQDTEANQ